MENRSGRNLARLQRCLRTIQRATWWVSAKRVKLFFVGSLDVQQQYAWAARAPASAPSRGRNQSSSGANRSCRGESPMAPLWVRSQTGRVRLMCALRQNASVVTPGRTPRDSSCGMLRGNRPDTRLPNSASPGAHAEETRDVAPSPRRAADSRRCDVRLRTRWPNELFHVGKKSICSLI